MKTSGSCLTSRGNTLKAPAFQFYAAEYLADEKVQLMSLEEEGCYIRLMAFCWREGSIPCDHEKLSRLCKGASFTLLAVVMECFQTCDDNPDRLIHKRLEAERRKQAEWREKSSAGGKKGAESRKLARVVEPTNQPQGNTAFASALASSSLSSSSLSTNTSVNEYFSKEAFVNEP